MLQVDLAPHAAATRFVESRLEGGATHATDRRVADMKDVFQDETLRSGMDPDRLMYQVFAHEAVNQGTPGGLFFGVTHLSPGTVGNEYFMTKGHTHARPECAEYYWGIEGTGFLVLFNATRAWVEEIAPGSLHYVPGRTAHRIVNTGDVVLKVGACWPSDAGHDYSVIKSTAFTVIIRNTDGRAQCVPNPAFG